jgi:hypothetical protein
MFDYLLHGYAFLCVMLFCVQCTIKNCRKICFEEMSKLKVAMYITFILSSGYIFFISISKCFAYFALFIKTL